MSERKAVIQTTALRYARSDRAAKKTILDELCALTLWHRDHARKALRQAVPKTSGAERVFRRRAGAPDLGGACCEGHACPADGSLFSEPAAA